MTNAVTLKCDGTIGLGTQAPAPCANALTATSRYMPASSLRKVAKERGWSTTRRQKIRAPFIRRDGFRGERTWTVPVDLCPSHNTPDQIKFATRERVLPTLDQREPFSDTLEEA